jgi:hypothetical protein
MSNFENSIEFGFKFVTAGFSAGLPGKAIADTRSVRLRDVEVSYTAIREARARGNRLVFLVDTTRLPQGLLSEVQQNMLVLEVSPSKADEVRLFVNQQISIAQATSHHQDLVHQGQANAFRAELCPACNATIDLSGRPESPYLYCHKCENLAIKNPSTGRYIVTSEPDNARQGQCEVCGYYGRIKEYKETNAEHYVIVVVRRTSFRQTCDSCAGEYARQYFYDGIRGLGTRLKTMRGQGEVWKALARANTLAVKKDLTGATEIYNELLQLWPSHPGLLFNLAMGHAGTGNTTEAEVFARRALKACANYHPALVLLKKLAEMPQKPSGPPRPPQLRPQPPSPTLPRPPRAPGS